MKILKIFAIVVGAALVLFAAVAIYLIAVFDPNSFKEQIAQTVKQRQQRTLKIEGSIALSIFPSLGVNIGKTSLSERNSEAVFARIDSAHVALALMPLLSKEIVVDRLTLSGLSVEIIRGKDGKNNLDDLLAKPAAGGAAKNADAGTATTKFEIGGIDISNAALSYRDEAANTQQKIDKVNLKTGRIANGVPGKVEWSAAIQASKPPVALDLRGSAGYLIDTEKKEYALSDLKASISGNAAGVQNLAVKFSVDKVESVADVVKAGKLAIEVEAKMGEMSIKGSAATPVSVAMKEQVIELAKLAGEITVSSPAMPMKSAKVTMDGSARIDLARQVALREFTLKLDDSTLRGKLSLTNFSAPAISFDLNLDKLDVDKYLPPPQATPGAGKPAGKEAEKPIDLSSLKSVNANGSVKIGALTVSHLKLKDLKLEIKAAGGKLDVAPYSASLYDGTLAGALSVDANSNRITLKHTLTGVNINPLMKDAVNRDLIEGRGNISVDVTTAGGTQSAMKKGLGGTASVALKDGAFKGINLAKSFRDAKAMISGKQDQEVKGNAAEKTDFSEMSASLKIANGIAHNDDLTAKSPFIRLGGTGDINIGAGSMDYLAKATLANTSSGQGGKELGSMAGLTVPVRVSGPFEALNYKIEFSQLAGEILKQQLDSRKEEVKAKVQEKVQDQLKGLFKR